MFVFFSLIFFAFVSASLFVNELVWYIHTYNQSYISLAIGCVETSCDLKIHMHPRLAELLRSRWVVECNFSMEWLGNIIAKMYPFSNYFLFFKKICIPVGCVPPAFWPYPEGVCFDVDPPRSRRQTPNEAAPARRDRPHQEADPPPRSCDQWCILGRDRPSCEQNDRQV